MRKLSSILLAVLACICTLPLSAKVVQGTVIDGSKNEPIVGAVVTAKGQAPVSTDIEGRFTLNVPENVVSAEVSFPNFENVLVTLNDGMRVYMAPAAQENSDNEYFVADDIYFDETQVMDENDVSQSVGTIQGAKDNVFYQTANYDFSVARFRLRGYSDDWTDGYINGVLFNDAMRGKFNYSGLGGMTSSAFRNKSVEVGLDAADYGYGALGGSSNFTTYASGYAPGFRGNVSYTNSNYMLRAMLQYSTGLLKNGWAVSASVIGRYAPQGVSPIPGTWYNSFGYSLSVEKIFNDQHRLNLTTWGAPSQRASNSWTTQEAYDLAGNNLYNPNWGYQNGKKRSAKVVSSFDPSVILNWIWTPSRDTRLNTAVAFRHNEYGNTGLSWYNSPDPRADYYHKLPSDHLPTAEVGTALYDAQMAEYEAYVNEWQTNEAFRQLDWDSFYQANYLNNIYYEADPSQTGRATYIVEENHSNFNSAMLSSTLDQKLNDFMSFQGGVGFNYTNARYYKTIKDLLGAKFWLDIDSWAEGDFPGTDVLQNNLNDPNRRVKEGEVFGYDYNMLSFRGNAWGQTRIKTNHWDVNISAKIDYVNYWRDGNMRNGRAEREGVISYGAGAHHGYLTGAAKVGVTYKINGRNYIVGHVAGGNRAPVPYSTYVASRIKDTYLPGVTTEKYVSGDLSYIWNYHNFRGSITGYWTERYGGTDMTFYFDYDKFTNMTYSMTGIHTRYRGIELGLEYKLPVPGLSLSAAGTIASYQYKNNPTGCISYENGAEPDMFQTVYIKNYRIANTPQQAYSIAANYNIKNWFFEVNGAWTGDAYIQLAPTMHAEITDLYKVCSSKAELDALVADMTRQDKLKQGWTLNASIGKMIYTKFGAINFNLSVSNITNNRNIQTSGKQELKYRIKNDGTLYRWGNKYYYAQGIRVFFNFGIRF